MTVALGYAALDARRALGPFHFERRELRPRDVRIQIAYCGVCHSDLHQARNEWGDTRYPLVPGHEIVGRVTDIGPGVERHRVGDVVGVGPMVDSDRTCRSCRQGLQQYCESGFVPTYNGLDRLTGEPTYGGYSDHIVVDEAFVLRVTHGDERDLPAVAPLLCAGITTYSPLRHWKVGIGQKVGIIGLGGLGHMAIKLAAALGAHVVLITHSPRKLDDALRLGAHEAFVSADDASMRLHANTFDFILDTVSAPHSLDPYLSLLGRDGTLTLVGAPPQPVSVAPFSLIPRRHSVAGSLIGGLPATQDMLDFCADRGIVSDIELIPIQDIDSAFERLQRGDVRYRFVVDLGSLRAAVASRRP